MATIKITCMCEAIMEAEGNAIYCELEADRFLKAHEKCRKDQNRKDTGTLEEVAKDAGRKGETE